MTIRLLIATLLLLGPRVVQLLLLLLLIGLSVWVALRRKIGLRGGDGGNRIVVIVAAGHPKKIRSCRGKRMLL